MKPTFEEYYPSLVINVKKIVVLSNHEHMKQIDINNGGFKAYVHEGMVNLINPYKTYRFFFFLPEATDQYIKVISFKIDNSMPV